MYQVTVNADKQVVAPFVPCSQDEEQYLFDHGNSSCNYAAKGAHSFACGSNLQVMFLNWWFDRSDTTTANRKMPISTQVNASTGDAAIAKTQPNAAAWDGKSPLFQR